tara:strand:- start:1836 stop:3017 length:1182 start_codon:yes stop_codon:yes gene_type:complete
MKEIHSNINIIGGGLIGAITAYSLSKLNFNISVLEKKPPYSKEKYKDLRTTAISEGTKIFLDKIGIWKDIKKFSEPIKKIKVIDRKLSNQLNFDNNRRRSNLGYIIENRNFLETVYKKLKNKKNVKILNNFNINNFETNEENIITISNNLKIFADINIAADGKKSFVKKIFKTPSYHKDYKKSALVLTLTHSNNHNGTAFEFFYKNGPLAILPMKSNKGSFASSIIWTEDKETLKNLCDLEIKKLISVLEDKTNNCIGNIKTIISKQVFPLSSHVSSRFYEKRTIYIGDSAHSFHPIAGQGWNLGMSDVQSLFNLVNYYKSLGIDLGDSFFCKKFHDYNFHNAYKLYQITDKLDSIFQVQNIIFRLGRQSGIKYINKNKKFKNLISDFAMGLN